MEPTRDRSVEDPRKAKQPAAGEEITTALPEPRLYVQGSAKVQQIAAEKKLPIDEVARMLASYLGSDEIRSPAERRIELLRDYWRIFDEAHAEQKPGMSPLTSLVGEPWLAAGRHVPFQTPVYERMLPAQMLLEIERLWSGECLPRYPERIVSSLFPHAHSGRIRTGADVLAQRCGHRLVCL